MSVASNIPAPGLPVVGPDGRLNQVWFAFFMQLWRRTGGAEGAAAGDLSLSDLDLDAVAVSADVRASIGELDEMNTALQLEAGDRDISKVTTAISDANALIRALVVDDGITSQQTKLLAKVIDLSLILEEAQDVAKRLRQAINDAVIDAMTSIDPVRSMAYQDASRVAIKGGAIEGTSVGATTPAAGTFTSLIGNTALESQVPNVGQITMRPNNQFSVAARNWAFRVNHLAYGDWCAMVSTTNSNDPATVKLQYFNGLVITDGFGCNGKTAQPSYSLGAAATDLTSVIALANNLRAMSINNGTGA